MTLDNITKQVYCDRCPTAKAAYLIKLLDGELFFCNHHYNKYKEALDKKAYEVIQLDRKEELPLLEKEEINGK